MHFAATQALSMPRRLMPLGASRSHPEMHADTPLQFCSQLGVNLVDVIDVALVGRLGRQTVAAWGYATQCVNLVETLVQSVGIACVALVARAIGGRDPRRARQAVAASMMVSLSVAAAGLLLTLLVPRVILAWLDATPDVIAIAVPYFRLDAGSMVLYAADRKSTRLNSSHLGI